MMSCFVFWVIDRISRFQLEVDACKEKIKELEAQLKAKFTAIAALQQELVRVLSQPSNAFRNPILLIYFSCLVRHIG